MRIPTESIETQRIQPTPFSPKIAAQAGEEMSAMGDALGAVTEHFEQLRDKSEIIKQKTDAIRQMAQANMDAAKDPDLATAPKRYEERLRQIVDETSQGITSPQARNQFKDEMQLHLETRSIAIQNMINKRSIDQAQAVGFEHMDELKTQYQTAAHEGHADAILTEGQNTVKSLVDSGAMNSEAAYKYLKEWKNDLHESLAVSDIESFKESPDGKKLLTNLLAEVDKGEKGIYKLTLDQENKIKPKAEAALKYTENREKANIKNINHMTDKDMTWKYVQHTLSQDELDRNFNKMTPGRYKTLSDGLKKPDYSVKPHAKEYNEMMDYLADETHSERECIDKLLHYETTGKLSAGEAKSLTHLFYIPTDKDPVFKLRKLDLASMVEAQEQKNQQHNDIASRIGAFWKSLFGGHKEKSEIMQRVSDAKQKADSSGLPAQYITKIAEQEKQKYISEKRPDLNNIPMGKVKRTSDGAYGVKTESGWRAATTAEIQQYKTDNGLE